MQELQQKIGYVFNNQALLTQALTHASSSLQPNNERLEFLGDRVLNLLIAQRLLELHPNADEGQMARLHTRCVCADILAYIARRIELGSALHVGSGEEKSGGRHKNGILADAMEALLGAVYLDGGLGAVQQVVQGLWPRDIWQQLDVKDAKTALQELLQGWGEPLPEYTVVEAAGKAHARAYVIEVQTVRGKAIGRGSSKQAAQKQAAEKLLATLQQETP